MQSNFSFWPHLVEESPWPLYTSMGAFSLTGGGVLWWHHKVSELILLGMGLTLLSAWEWWSNVMFENSTGHHKNLVVTGLRVGMMLFMVSEMMFFFSFFWAFFCNCFNPESEMGFIWPPLGFDYMMMDPFSIPLLKSVLLLSSGATITSAHHYLLNANFKLSKIMLGVTIMLGVVFLGLQGFEYTHSLVSINSLIYGSTFFLLTGFHGFHVTVGAIFLLVCLARQLLNNVSSHNHVGFEAASWYWHFVDVVWLFLYFFIYWYGFNG